METTAPKPDPDSSQPGLPDSETLVSVLARILADNAGSLPRVTLLERKSNPRASTFPSEIVTCRADDQEELVLLCKYPSGRPDRSHDHRGGLARELAVYRRVLEPLGVTTPRCYGAEAALTGSGPWLVLEYVSGDKRMSQRRSPSAAAWLGRFHRQAASHIGTLPGGLFKTYDQAYYLGWARRTAEYAGHLHAAFPWLQSLCDRADRATAMIDRLPVTFVHGEYYCRNIMRQQEMIRPIDWESGAIAFGEIDLAALTDHARPDVVEQCQAAYQRARWPEGVPTGFEERYNLARLYLQLRWLGDRPGWTTRQADRWRFEELRVAAERLGLL